jgi:hypothetical protein
LTIAQPALRLPDLAELHTSAAPGPANLSGLFDGPDKLTRAPSPEAPSPEAVSVVSAAPRGSGFTGATSPTPDPPAARPAQQAESKHGYCSHRRAGHGWWHPTGIVGGSAQSGRDSGAGWSGPGRHQPGRRDRSDGRPAAYSGGRTRCGVGAARCVPRWAGSAGCLRGSPIERGVLSSWRRKRPGCSTTTTSVPSTSSLA